MSSTRSGMLGSTRSERSAAARLGRLLLEGNANEFSVGGHDGEFSVADAAAAQLYFDVEDATTAQPWPTDDLIGGIDAEIRELLG